jgi:hypothetical protein
MARTRVVYSIETTLFTKDCVCTSYRPQRRFIACLAPQLGLSKGIHNGNCAASLPLDKEKVVRIGHLKRLDGVAQF